MCKSPLDCNFSCPSCLQWKEDMNDYFSTRYFDVYKCTKCGTADTKLDPLYWTCARCTTNYQKLYTWINETPCHSCHQICPSPSAATIYDAYSKQYRFNFSYFIIHHPNFDKYRFVIRCRACCYKKSKCRTSKRISVGRAISNNCKLVAGECRVCKLPCNEDNLKLFEWDHIYPRFRQGKFISSWYKPSDHAFTHTDLVELIQELLKCRLLCVNCHDAQSKWQRDNIMVLIRYYHWDYCAQAFSSQS